MDKAKTYQTLVEKRKMLDLDNLTNEKLTNPSKTLFDSNHLDNWAIWQGSLNAKILVIGQDFADFKTFVDAKGKVEPENGKYAYPSNKYLKELFSSIGIEIGHPNTPIPAEVFLTSAILGLKQEGGMTGKIESRWIGIFSSDFIKPLIEIIEPKIIITLGNVPSHSIFKIFGDSNVFKDKSITKSHSLKDKVEKAPYKLTENMWYFPMFHCGGLGIRNRSFADQKEDWKKIKNIYESL